MAISQSRSKRKVTGSRYKDYRKKKLNELGSNPAFTKVGPKKKEVKRVLGGNYKNKAFSLDIANIYDPKTKKYTKLKIKSIKENAANRNFIRRNIMNKGSVIETEQGDAKVTSKPGQHGVVNAILISK